VFGALEHGRAVDREDALPLGELELVGRPVGTQHAGVVDRHVDASELVGHRGEGRLDRGLLGDVDLLEDGWAPPLASFLSDVLAPLVAVEDSDRRPLLGQPRRDGLTEGVRSTGDDGDPAVESGVLCSQRRS
jgi:hypothetical protein